MSEMSTQGGTSGEGTGGDGATPTPGSGEPATVTPAADTFAAERAALEAERARWQGQADKNAAEAARLREQLAAQTPATSAAPAETVPVRDLLREELRRQREFDSTVASLREKFPGAGDVFDRVDSFDSVEQLQAAAEASHNRFTGQMAPHVQAAVEAALKPYVEKFGPLQAPPAAATPGAGDGLPTFEEISRMSLAERGALEDAHPGLADRVIAQRLSTL